MGRGKKKAAKNRGKQPKFSITKTLKNKAGRIAKMLKGFKSYKRGEIPIWLEKGLNGPNKKELYDLVIKRL